MNAKNPSDNLRMAPLEKKPMWRTPHHLRPDNQMTVGIPLPDGVVDDWDASLVYFTDVLVIPDSCRARPASALAEILRQIHITRENLVLSIGEFTENCPVDSGRDPVIGKIRQLYVQLVVGCIRGDRRPRSDVANLDALWAAYSRNRCFPLMDWAWCIGYKELDPLLKVAQRFGSRTEVNGTDLFVEMGRYWAAVWILYRLAMGWDGMVPGRVQEGGLHRTLVLAPFRR